MNIRSLLLCGLLGLTSATGLSLALPQNSQAYISRQEIRVDRLTNEPYDAFMRRSELVARAAIQRAFDRDIVMSSVVLFIMGQHQGMEAPVMSVEVSRSQWQSRPDPRVWATYYRMSQRLLGFNFSDSPNLPQPAATPATPASPFSLPITPRRRLIPKTTATPTATPTASPEPLPEPSPTPDAPPDKSDR